MIMSEIKRGRGRPKKPVPTKKCPACGKSFTNRRFVYCSLSCSNVGRTGTYKQSKHTAAKRTNTLRTMMLFDSDYRQRIGRGAAQPITPIFNPFEDEEDNSWL
jgi:endogenous inhibitor of DNA gyrase (YacG/DUF329 family)